MMYETPLERTRVLIVDDRKDARTLMRSMLNELGVTQIFEAADGKEGLEFMDVGYDSVDVILCDWCMPHIDGLQFLKQVREAHTDIPVVFVTGRSDKDSVNTAKDAGIRGYLLKPFDEKQLEAKLRIARSYRTIHA